MGLYIAIWIALLVLATARREHRLLLWAVVVGMSLLAGLRDLSIGVDTRPYHEAFTIAQDGRMPPMEPGWGLLNIAVARLGGNFNLLLWIVSITTLGLVTRVATKDSPNPRFSLFIYYSMYAYLNSFNGMRQFLAISIVLWGFHLLYRNKVWKFLITIGMAMTIHLSSIIGFVALITRKIPLKPWILYTSLSFSLLTGLFIIKDTWLIPLLGPYGVYLQGDNFSVRESLSSAVIMALLMNCLLLFLYHTAPVSFRNNFWLKLFWMGILVTNISLQLVLGTRMILYFTITQVTLFPQYLSAKQRDIPLVSTLLILYLLLIFLKILILGNDGQEGSIYPYKSVLSA